MPRILLLNGPNLNLLGTREPHLYGAVRLPQIEADLTALAQSRGHELRCEQSNAEHILVEHVQSAPSQNVRFLLINPGALTHSSISLRDALLAVALPFIEIHLSNVFAREEFRRRSFLSDIAAGCIIGFGPLSYELALEAACRRLGAT